MRKRVLARAEGNTHATPGGDARGGAGSTRDVACTWHNVHPLVGRWSGRPWWRVSHWSPGRLTRLRFATDEIINRRRARANRQVCLFLSNPLPFPRSFVASLFFSPSSRSVLSPSPPFHPGLSALSFFSRYFSRYSLLPSLSLSSLQLLMVKYITGPILAPNLHEFEEYRQ